MIGFFSRQVWKQPHHPEHAFRVWDSGDALHCQRNQGEECVLRWDVVSEISIVTTGEGPFLPDVFWRFRSDGEEVFSPQMALAEKEVLARAMKLECFDLERFTAAMSSTQNAEFLVWRKK